MMLSGNSNIFYLSEMESSCQCQDDLVHKSKSYLLSSFYIIGDLKITNIVIASKMTPFPEKKMLCE